MYELRAKMSKYTPKSIQLLEGSNDIPLLIHLQSKYQTSYNHALYGSWWYSMPVPNVGTKFSFCGNSYMVAKSKIDIANIGLLMISQVCVPANQSIALIPLCIPLYS